MSELGLFPLPLVLLPTELVPLHIFEERYRELIGECLESDEEFGLVYADDDGLREVGTRAAVVNVLMRFDDGRMDIVVEGRARFRLLALTTGRSYHTGAVAPVAVNLGSTSASRGGGATTLTGGRGGGNDAGVGGGATAGVREILRGIRARPSFSRSRNGTKGLWSF